MALAASTAEAMALATTMAEVLAAITVKAEKVARAKELAPILAAHRWT
ncbi:hypothetical protein NKH73_29180 [Mesorhizobium sp. M0938]